MKTSLWVVVVVVSGIVGFLIGYSASSHTGSRSLAGSEAAAPRPMAPATQPAGAPAAPAATASPAGGYGDKATPPQASPAAPATASSASEKAAAPGKAPGGAAEKKGGTTGGY